MVSKCPCCSAAIDVTECRACRGMGYVDNPSHHVHPMDRGVDPDGTITCGVCHGARVVLRVVCDHCRKPIDEKTHPAYPRLHAACVEAFKRAAAGLKFQCPACQTHGERGGTVCELCEGVGWLTYEAKPITTITGWTR